MSTAPSSSSGISGCSPCLHERRGCRSIHPQHHPRRSVVSEVSVIASIEVKPGRLAEVLKIMKANVPTVRAEKGCVEYRPTVDAATGMPRQVLDANLITLIERWESLAALEAHLATPHMAAYREQVKELVVRVGLKILQNA
ncbi:MAG: antibiotic biosynthesis monooxygenase [Lentisphaerales bacterium]|nr:MAG: antibiotic biosynthesis monooxygenase [Lentisphaerales bacterium]